MQTCAPACGVKVKAVNPATGHKAVVFLFRVIFHLAERQIQCAAARADQAVIPDILPKFRRRPATQSSSRAALLIDRKQAQFVIAVVGLVVAHFHQKIEVPVVGHQIPHKAAVAVGQIREARKQFAACAVCHYQTGVCAQRRYHLVGRVFFGVLVQGAAGAVQLIAAVTVRVELQGLIQAKILPRPADLALVIAARNRAVWSFLPSRVVQPQQKRTAVACGIRYMQRIRRAAAVGFAEQVYLTRADGGGCGGFGCRGRRVGHGRFRRRRAAGREGQAEGEGERKRPEEGLFHRDNRLSESWMLR